ncbi:MAG: O-antigen ligase family protein [Flavobacteriaceae bacterium]
MILLFLSCLLASFYFSEKPYFLHDLNTLLFYFTVYAIISCVILSLFPTQNVLFRQIDGKAAYVGYLYLFFQRINIDFKGFLDPTFIDYFGFTVQRAHGLAWEPGNFSTFVNVFIFLNLFIFKNVQRVLLGLLAILLAWSTSGFTVLILQFIYYVVINRRSIKRKYIIPKAVLGTIIAYALVITAYENFDEKINGDRSGSGAGRIVNTASAIGTIYNNPLVGTGFDYQRYAEELNKEFRKYQSAVSSYVDSDKVNSASSTNSFLRLYVQFGIPIGLVLTISIFKQTLIPRHKFIFAVVIISSCLSAPMMLTPFYFLFIASGLIKLAGFSVRKTTPL